MMTACSGERRIDVPCTVEIENTFESLHAHVELDGDIDDPAGRQGHGARRADARAVRRDAAACAASATVTRAHGRSSGCGRALSGCLELTELYEVSFSRSSEA